MFKGFPPPNVEKGFPPPMMDTSYIKRKWLDLAYAHQSPTQKLDIYLPENGDGPFPVILVIHGGAWMIGEKGDVQNAPMLKGLDRGYAVVSINYRLSHEAIFPAQIFDCKTALRFIKANASKYLLNKEKIAAWGGSAGGHLSAMLGTSAGVDKLEDSSTGNLDENTQIQAVADWYGPTEDFLKMDEELIETGNGVPDHSNAESPESKLLGKKITEVPELVKLASPMTYITPAIPPFLIQHGYQDELVPVQQSIHFAAELEKVAGKDKVVLEIFKNNVHHADPYFETDKNVSRVLDYLDQHLK
jgi:acetyl esterase/lipase